MPQALQAKLWVLLLFVSYPLIAKDDRQDDFRDDHQDDRPLQVSIFRINGKRFKKLARGSSAVFVPSMGLPLAAALPEAICPKTLRATDEVLEIVKAAPADDEIRGLVKEIDPLLHSCGSETVTESPTPRSAKPTGKAPAKERKRQD